MNVNEEAYLIACMHILFSVSGDVVKVLWLVTNTENGDMLIPVQ